VQLFLKTSHKNRPLDSASHPYCLVVKVHLVNTIFQKYSETMCEDLTPQGECAALSITDLAADMEALAQLHIGAHEDL
jgi:hypothetical protein